MCLSLRLWRGSADKRGERAIAWQLVQRSLKAGDIAAAEEVCCGGGVDTATWTAVIAANAEAGHLDRAIQLLDAMTGYGVVADSVTFVTLLGACSRHHALDEGRLVHDRLKAATLRHDIKVANAVVNMYAKCGAVSEAAHCFAALPSPDVVSWTVMVGLYANDGSSRSTEMLYRMQQAGVRPNRVTFITVLRGCEQVSRGRMVHSLLDEAGLLEDVPTCNALLGMYSRCGSLKDAMVTFDLMQHRDVVTWTTMVAAQVQEGRHRAGLLVYRQMLLDGGSRPSALSLSAALAACSCDLDSGRKLHAQAWEAVGDGDVAVSLVSMYGRCRRPREARQAFEKVPAAERGRMLWNAMVTAHSDAGEHSQALDVFRKMQLECGGGNSDRITIVAALNACASLGDWTSGRSIYEACAGRALAVDVMVATTALNMYSRCGKLCEARTVFDGIAIGSRDVVAWNAMVAAYAGAQQGREAVAVSRAMHCEGIRPSKATLVSLLSSGCGLREGRLAHGLAVEAGMLDDDVVLATALLNMYAACGELERAAAVFEAAAEGRCSGDVVLWTSMVVAYEQAGKHDKALAVYAAMPMRPDSVAVAAALLAAGGLAALSAGREIHSKLSVELVAEVRVGNALVAMYGKCGSPAEAAEVFRAMRNRDATSWGCLVGAFAAKGQGKAAVKALRSMRQEGWVPAQATVVAALAACSHDGMLEEGCHVFGAEAASTTVTIEMCGCVVDMLCRAGHLDKAEELIRSSRLASPNTVLWSTLLAACNVHGDVERGRRAAQEVKRIDPKNDAPYVVLSTMVTR